MMPEHLYRLDIATTIFSRFGLTIEQWVDLYVESGQAAKDYDQLLSEQREAWLSELYALAEQLPIRSGD